MAPPSRDCNTADQAVSAYAVGRSEGPPHRGAPRDRLCQLARDVTAIPAQTWQRSCREPPLICRAAVSLTNGIYPLTPARAKSYSFLYRYVVPRAGTLRPGRR